MKSNNKILHIDASRLKSGGGILHLVKLLEYAKYSNFDKIIIYTYQNNKFKIYENEQIKVTSHPFINKTIFHQIIWQKFLLAKNLNKKDLLFTIDSTSFCRFKNTVILNQDIIGFQEGSLKYFTIVTKFYSFLKYLTAKSAIKNSLAVIFTTKYAQSEVFKKTGILDNSIVIPHGIDGENLNRKINFNISNDHLKIIYVSPILDYKNHQFLISALDKFDTVKKVEVFFVGGGNPKLIKKLKKNQSTTMEIYFISWVF